jgi:translation initiation factor 1 (eIF-1/SUI1)
MTKKLESLFELPETSRRPNEEEITTTSEEITAIVEMSNLEKIENALTAVRGLEASDEEMDSLAKQAVESYKDNGTMDWAPPVDLPNEETAKK